MPFHRILDLQKAARQKSLFLFGPRGTGKSTLIRQQLNDAKIYDLLDERVYLRLLKDPSILEQENPTPNTLIVIDEIQKLPKLLDEVHRLIFHYQHRFLLTGSSPRKLKRGGANLLGGRAREYHFFPLTYPEINNFNLTHFLNYGGLPSIYLSDEPTEDLKSYISLYLREEIAAEALTRRLDQFSRFLEILALHNGEELHFQNLSSDSGVPASTLKNYIEVIEDTLLGFQVPPFQTTQKRKAISRSKFFYFDLGVCNALLRRPRIEVGSELFGRAFEHFIALELRAANKLLKRDESITYWRTKSGFEVDFVIGDHTAIEVKATTQITDRHLKGLRALKEENKLKEFIIVSQDSAPRKTPDGIRILPWEVFLREWWGRDQTLSE